jgi:hypothetical protein
VRCTNCDAVLPPGAEFCRECGMPTDPGLRARLEQAQAAEDPDPKRVRRTIFIAGAALLFGIVIGSWTGAPGPSIAIDPTDWTDQERPAVVGAQEFFQAYRDDADGADRRFDDRWVVMTGEFVGIRHDDQGNPDLRLKAADPNWSVGADLLPDSYDKSAQLKSGQTVTVSCERVRRTGEERWLRNCSIEELAPGEIAPREAGSNQTDAATSNAIAAMRE